MSKHIDLQITKVGNIVMLEEEDWNRVVEYLRVHDLNVTEKPAQHSVQRIGGTCRVCRKPAEKHVPGGHKFIPLNPIR